MQRLFFSKKLMWKDIKKWRCPRRYKMPIIFNLYFVFWLLNISFVGKVWQTGSMDSSLFHASLICNWVNKKTRRKKNFQFKPERYRRCPRGVMVKGLDCGIIVQTPVVLLHSLSDKYLWERYEPPYPPSYSNTTVLLEGYVWH